MRAYSGASNDLERVFCSLGLQKTLAPHSTFPAAGTWNLKESAIPRVTQQSFQFLPSWLTCYAYHPHSSKAHDWTPAVYGLIWHIVISMPLAVASVAPEAGELHLSHQLPVPSSSHQHLLRLRFLIHHPFTGHVLYQPLLSLLWGEVEVSAFPSWNGPSQHSDVWFILLLTLTPWGHPGACMLSWNPFLTPALLAYNSVLSSHREK